MSKLKSLVLFLIVLVFAGCSLSNEPSVNSEKKLEGSVSRGGSLPSTKVVTVERGTISLRLYPKNISSEFAAIRNGSRTTFYNDANYSGYIKSTSFRVVSAPVKVGEFLVFKVKITYSGTVELKIPATKVVTVTRGPVYVRMKPKDVSATLSGIRNGSRNTYYSDSDYAGYINSTSFKVVTAPANDGDYLIFKMNITYSGTVNRR